MISGLIFAQQATTSKDKLDVISSSFSYTQQSRIHTRWDGEGTSQHVYWGAKNGSTEALQIQ